MKAAVTLDYYDGTKSKVKVLNMDGTGMNQLVFMLMQGDVAGFTVTKADVLGGIDKMEREVVK